MSVTTRVLILSAASLDTLQELLNEYLAEVEKCKLSAQLVQINDSRDDDNEHVYGFLVILQIDETADVPLRESRKKFLEKCQIFLP